MKKSLILLMFAALFTAELVAQIPYTIRFKTNTGAEVGGNSYLQATSATTFTQLAALPAIEADNANRVQWYFIPVGDEISDGEPGWYYIRNAGTGGYLRAPETGNNVAIIMTATRGASNEQSFYQWRLVKTTASTGANPATARHFKLVSRQANKVIARNAAGNDIRVNTNYAVANSTVQLALAIPNDVFNEDMELISNHTPYAEAGGWDGVPDLPETTVPDFLDGNNPSQATASSTFSPVGYATSGGICRLIHDHYASGDNPGDGYYFSRLYPGATMDIVLSNSASNASTALRFGCWVKARIPGALPTGLDDRDIEIDDDDASSGGGSAAPATKEYKVATIQFGTSTVHVYDIWLSEFDDANDVQEDPSKWIYYEIDIPTENLTQDQITASTTMHISSLLGANSRLDVDNFAVEKNEIDSRAFLYHHFEGANAGNGNGSVNGKPQKVHTLTQIIYTQPNMTEPLVAATTEYSYYRWHVKEVFNKQYILQSNIAGIGNANVIIHDKGKIFYSANPNAQTQGTNNIRAPRELDTWYNPYLDDYEPFIVSCDASNYVNFAVGGPAATSTAINPDNYFREPTLSYRHNFELLPAWVIAKAINDSLAHNRVYEEVNVTAPVGGAANAVGGATYTNYQGTNTRLRLGPQFSAPRNYWILNIAGEYAPDAIYNGTTPGLNMLRGYRFVWVKSTNGAAASNPTLTLAGTENNITINGAPTGVTLIRATGNTAYNNQPADPYYFPLGSLTEKPYLQINTAGKAIGSIEYYDVYVMDDNATVANRIVKKVARFTVKYVPRGAATDVLANGINSAPGAPVAGYKAVLPAYGPVQNPSGGDLLSVIANKELIKELNFDQEGKESIYGFGKTPLAPEESTYGFVDPSLMTPSTTAPGRALNFNVHHSNPYAFYGEYSFPQAVRGGITGGDGYPAAADALQYTWYIDAPGNPPNANNQIAAVYDRTYYNTGGVTGTTPTATATIGNMMFVDASQIKGTVATLKINEAMCPGTELYFSAWIVNMNTTSGQAAEGSAAGTNSRPNLIFLLKDSTSGNEITRFYTGDIGRDAAGRWFQVAFNFQVPDSYLEATTDGKVNFVLEIINNGLNSAGNDFAIDDIKIYRSNPSVIAVRTNDVFCKPDGEFVTSTPLNMSVDIDIDQMTSITSDLSPSQGMSNILYFRFLDGNKKAFPDTTDENNDIYVGQGIHTVSATSHFSYGKIDMTKFTGGLATDTARWYVVNGVDNKDIILTTEHAHIGVNHLIFKQSIPPNVLDDNGGMGTYSIYVAEAAGSLLTPSCSGKCSFVVKYDETDFAANISGSTEAPTPPSDLIICTNRVAVIHASSKDALTGEPVTTQYDWYTGPIDTYVTADADELEEIEYDIYLNLIGYNHRCFVVDGTLDSDNANIHPCSEFPDALTADEILARAAIFAANAGNEPTWIIPDKEDYEYVEGESGTYASQADADAAYKADLATYHAVRIAFIFQEYTDAIVEYDALHKGHTENGIYIGYTTDDGTHYSVKRDLIALRHFYPRATTRRPHSADIDDITHFPVTGQTTYTQVDEGTPMEGTTYIPDVAALQQLLYRIRYYVQEEIITLYQDSINVTFGSLAPYFYTVIPLNMGTKLVGETPQHVELCTTPTEVHLRASNWGPEVDFGKLNVGGRPTTVYRHITSPEYCYTVRLPEKTKTADGELNATQFVLPMLFMDESFLARVELLKVNDTFIDANGEEYVPDAPTPNLQTLPGYKIANVHIGVIDPDNPNQLDKASTVRITQVFDPETPEGGYKRLDEIDEIEDFLAINNAEEYTDGEGLQTDGDIHYLNLKTYWNLDDKRGPFRAYESFPLTYNAYSYFNPDPYPDHLLEVEGDPLPLYAPLPDFAPWETNSDKFDSTKPTMLAGEQITNNKLALEVQAEYLPAAYRNSITVEASPISVFKPGTEYLFRFMCAADAFTHEAWEEQQAEGTESCDKEFYFRLRVVPDTVYWNDEGENESWHNDANWQFHQTPSALAPAFAPLKETNVVLPSDMSHYPILNNDSIVTAFVSDEERTALNPDAKETRFIEYDYNFVPNSVSQIHFKYGSELGNQYFLDYDSAKVDLEVVPVKWYGLSAPLRDMYSGDYMFTQANPVTEMKLYNTTNPQTLEAAPLDWTTPFNTTTVRLAAGLGYTLRVGSLYYGTVDPVAGALASSKTQLTAANIQKFYFPHHNMRFQLYNEINKKPTNTIQNIPAGGRYYSGRFVYETTETESGKSVVATASNKEEDPQTVLVEIPTKVTDAGQLVVVGNPFMAHIDFEKFYAANHEVITPGFKWFDGVRYNSLLGIAYAGDDGTLDSPLTAEPAELASVSLTSIAPMQSFVVTTKAGYTGSPNYLVITKEMSYVAPPTTVDAAPLLRRSVSAEPDVLRIKATKDSLTTYAAVAVTDNASNGYVLGEDSRRVQVSNVSSAPNVFTIIDGMYLDINRLEEFPTSLPIGILTTSKGNTSLTISGLGILNGGESYYFKDTYATPELSPLAGLDNFVYHFDNTEGDQIGRFYIVYDPTVVSNDNSTAAQGNIQIYTYQGFVHILTSDGANLHDVAMYGVDGLKIYQQTKIGTSHLAIPMSALPNPVLIVKANTDKTTQVAKIIVSH